ncbi:hypothetical protein [Erythrobacter longus]|nr:hypothetical protein [Erythrobacter longus]
MIEALKAGQLQFPLTSGILIETYRMRNDDHRRLIAEVQARLSQGRVFRNRDFLIRHEILRFFEQDDPSSISQIPPLWWMSRHFLEAFVDFQTAISEMGLEAHQVKGLLADPILALFDWVASAPSDEREMAIGHWEREAGRLISQFDERRSRLKDESFSMQKRVYATTLAIEEQDRIISVCLGSGRDWNQLTENGPKILKDIIQYVSTYQAEIALACSIERLGRQIQLNDLRDMSSYVAVLPNSDVIIGEKLFVNLARQGGLGKRFGCELHTDLSSLKPFL